jgi:hypothetical protein
MPEGCYVDGTQILNVHMTVTLRVRRKVHFGGVMLKLMKDLLLRVLHSPLKETTGKCAPAGVSLKVLKLGHNEVQ